jgi:hypothetical protein
MYINDYSMWTENVTDKEWYKEQSVSWECWVRVVFLLLLFNLLYVIVYLSCLTVVILINYFEFLLHDGLKFCLLTSHPKAEIV